MRGGARERERTRQETGNNFIFILLSISCLSVATDHKSKQSLLHFHHRLKIACCPCCFFTSSSSSIWSRCRNNRGYHRLNSGVNDTAAELQSHWPRLACSSLSSTLLNSVTPHQRHQRAKMSPDRLNIFSDSGGIQACQQGGGLHWFWSVRKDPNVQLVAGV